MAPPLALTRAIVRDGRALGWARAWVFVEQPNHRGGRMLGYRFDPPSGPSKTVITGLTGGGHPVTHLDEYATAMQARGISFISLVWPGAHNGYSFQHFSNGTGPTDLAGVRGTCEGRTAAPLPAFGDGRLAVLRRCACTHRSPSIT